MARPRSLPRNFTIRRATSADAPAFVRMFSDPGVITMTLQLPFPSEDVWRERLSQGAGEHLVLIAHVGDEPVGNAGLHPIGKSPRLAHARTLGLSVCSRWQRRGIGNALMAALIDYADRWLNVARLELGVFTDNRAAIALYRKFGFAIEGTHPQHSFRDGRFADVYTMGRLRPPAARTTSAKTKKTT
jgi:putative acetyltransferase